MAGWRRIVRWGSRQSVTGDQLEIAVVGTGIAGMAAAWLLSHRHRVTVYEQAPRIGGHSHTIEATRTYGDGTATAVPVDTGFIVYNDRTYPNLVALFRHLDVPTKPSEMSFAVSLGNGALEYGGDEKPHLLFAQPRNLFRPRFWHMIRDLLRFYRDAPADLAWLQDGLLDLGTYLAQRGYGAPFIEDHLLPMAAAVWSTPTIEVRDYPAAAFIRFCDNHGLLRITDRPEWRTVDGGSRAYVQRLTARYADRLRPGRGVVAVRRDDHGIELRDTAGEVGRFDQVVIAAHADEALSMLEDPSDAEAALLGAFRYSNNRTVLHRDPALMPRRRRIWSSWNYIGGAPGEGPCVTYWMNRLQGLPGEDLFVTLNPVHPPAAGSVISSEICTHPLFDVAAARAQRELWSLQGQRRTWYCGAHFGAGFHEDGLQAGLAVAEQLGGVRRPWQVPNESGRIHLGRGAASSSRPITVMAGP
jgi:predicted NAD/FAD-binding protein